MAIEALRTVVEYHDYVQQLLPDEPTPELMNGRFVMAALPLIRHARYLREILKAIDGYIIVHQLAGEVLPEVEVVLDDFTVVIPELAYAVIDQGQARIAEERIYGAPEFVCEIASPSTRQYDGQEKFLAYLRAGVQEYWIVDPDLPAGKRFLCYERTAYGTVSSQPTFRRIAGGLADSIHFPGIAIAAKLR